MFTTTEIEPSPRVTGPGASGAMKALVFHGPGKRAWEEKPKPAIRAAGDAIVRITTSTICGTDLHILKGDVASVTDGRILGHEGIGVIEELGPGVSGFQVGDRVLISCVTACLKCDFCKRGMYSHCRDGGWILGNTIDGTQAEYVRIPHADGSLYAFPPGADEEALVMLSDILPTGFECGVLNGQVKPGDSVAIVGAGPVGLAVLMTAQFYSPGSILVIDLDDKRLAFAKQLGATALINSADGRAVSRVMELTEGAGVDVAIEAVGVPGDLRHLPVDRRGRRADRERGRPRQAGGAASREALGPEHRADDAVGRHGHHAHAPEGREVGPVAAPEARDPSFRCDGRHESLRRLRRRRPAGRPEGRPQERRSEVIGRSVAIPDSLRGHRSEHRINSADT